MRIHIFTIGWVFFMSCFLQHQALAEPKSGSFVPASEPAKFMPMPHLLKIGSFSDLTNLHLEPDLWKPMLFRGKKETDYKLTRREGRTVIEAQSTDSASVFRRNLDIDPRQYPYISWEWMVPGLVQGADISRADTDDASARILIACEMEAKGNNLVGLVKNSAAEFLMGFSWNTRVLLYLWDNKAAVDTIVPSQRSSRLHYYIAESGEEKLGQWMKKKFNYYEHFYEAFGEYPKRLVAVGLMTDTDGTDETITAYFGDITLEAR